MPGLARLSGTIRPSTGAVSTTPAAAKEAPPALIGARARDAALLAQARAAAAAPAPGTAPDPAVLGPERGRAAAPVAPAPAPAAPAPGAVAPVEEKPAIDALRLEALARRERELNQARLAAKAERDTLAREKAEIDQRQKFVEEREGRLVDIEKRLNSYKFNPHLALADLQQMGVTFEMLAQAVVQGAATPEQIAATEASLARRETEDLRQEMDRRDQERQSETERLLKEQAAQRQREARDAERGRAERERAAADEFLAEIRSVALAEKASYPVVAARIDRGALERAYDFAERFLAKENRVPINAEILAGTEAELEAEVEAEQAALAGRRRPAAPPAGTLTNRLGPAPQVWEPERPVGPVDEAERRARTLRTLDVIFGRAPAR